MPNTDTTERRAVVVAGVEWTPTLVQITCRPETKRAAPTRRWEPAYVTPAAQGLALTEDGRDFDGLRDPAEAEMTYAMTHVASGLRVGVGGLPLEVAAGQALELAKLGDWTRTGELIAGDGSLRRAARRVLGLKDEG